MQRPVDVVSFDKPVADADRYLKDGLQFVSQVWTKSNWKPGDLTGKDGSDQAVKDKTASYAPPDQWDKITDLRSATSTGHVPVRSRPPNVALGWGGYDKFTHWQSCGRQITKDMVKKEKWSTDRSKSTRYNDEEGNLAFVIPSIVQEADYPPRTKSPVSLYEVFNPPPEKKSTAKSEELTAAFVGTRPTRKIK